MVVKLKKEYAIIRETCPYYPWCEGAMNDPCENCPKTIEKEVIDKIEVIDIDISRILEVVIIDYSNYCSWKCSNGGAYSYETRYIRDNIGEVFKIFYKSSSDFEFCQITGEYQRCDNCYYNACNNCPYKECIGKECPYYYDHCTAEPETISENEMFNILKNAIENRYYVEVTYLDDNDEIVKETIDNDYIECAKEGNGFCSNMCDL